MVVSQVVDRLDQWAFLQASQGYASLSLAQRKKVAQHLMRAYPASEWAQTLFSYAQALLEHQICPQTQLRCLAPGKTLSAIHQMFLDASEHGFDLTAFQASLHGLCIESKVSSAQHITLRQVFLLSMAQPALWATTYRAYRDWRLADMVEGFARMEDADKARFIEKVMRSCPSILEFVIELKNQALDLLTLAAERGPWDEHNPIYMHVVQMIGFIQVLENPHHALYLDLTHVPQKVEPLLSSFEANMILSHDPLNSAVAEYLVVLLAQTPALMPASTHAEKFLRRLQQRQERFQHVLDLFHTQEYTAAVYHFMQMRHDLQEHVLSRLEEDILHHPEQLSRLLQATLRSFDLDVHQRISVSEEQDVSARQSARLLNQFMKKLLAHGHIPSETLHHALETLQAPMIYPVDEWVYLVDPAKGPAAKAQPEEKETPLEEQVHHWLQHLHQAYIDHGSYGVGLAQMLARIERACAQSPDLKGALLGYLETLLGHDEELPKAWQKLHDVLTGHNHDDPGAGTSPRAHF